MRWITAGLVAAVLAAGCGSESPAEPSAANVEGTAEPETTTTTTSAPEPPEPPEWTIVDPDAFAGAAVHGLAAGPDAVVAVGSLDEEAARPVAWVSTDGREWERVDLPGTDGRHWEAPVGASSPDGFVVVASWTLDGLQGSLSEQGHVAWLTSNGRDWEFVDTATTGLQVATGVEEVEYTLRFDRPRALTRFRDQWVGAGEGGWDRSFDTWRQAAVVYTSADGRSWNRSSTLEEPLGGETVRYLNAIATDGARVVAVGYSTSKDPAGGVTDGTSWWSDDTGSWTLLHGGALGGPDDEEIHAVAAGPAGWVAAGLAEDTAPESLDTRAALWHSADGSTWTRVPHDPALFGGAGEIVEVHAVAVSGARYLAGGSWDGHAAFWESEDGTIWARVALDDEYMSGITHLVPYGDGYVAVAEDYGLTSVWTFGLEQP